MPGRRFKKGKGLLIPSGYIIIKQSETDEGSAFYEKTVQFKLVNKMDIDSLKRQIIISNQYIISNSWYKFEKSNTRPLIQLNLDTVSGTIEYYFGEKR